MFFVYLVMLVFVSHVCALGGMEHPVVKHKQIMQVKVKPRSAPRDELDAVLILKSKIDEHNRLVEQCKQLIDTPVTITCRAGAAGVAIAGAGVGGVLGGIIDFPAGAIVRYLCGGCTLITGYSVGYAVAWLAAWRKKLGHIEGLVQHILTIKAELAASCDEHKLEALYEAYGRPQRWPEGDAYSSHLRKRRR